MTCVEVMYHQPFASPFSSPVYPSASRATGGGSTISSGVTGSCSNGFSTGQSLSRMHHEPLNLGHTSSSLSALSSAHAASSSLSSSTSSSISSTPLSAAPSSYYPSTSFLLTPSSSGPPSGDTLISPSPPLLTSPQQPQQQQQQQQPQQPAPATETPSTSPHRHHSSSILSSPSSSSLSPPSSSNNNHHHHHQHHHNNHLNHHHQHQHQFNKDKRTDCELERTDNSEPKGAQYLTANCVLFTYANGSVGEMVDDHFSQALSGSHGDTNAETKQAGSKGPIPMSARDLPPSFWNSSYYQHLQQQHQQQQQQYHNMFSQHHRNLHHHHQQQSQHLQHSGGSTSASDMSLHSTAHYFSPALHGFSNLQSEAWGYGLSSPATGMSYSHRHMPYDLSSYSSSARFGQNYNPFLMQPSVVRTNPFSGMPGHSDVTKEHSRTSRFPDHRIGADYSTHPSFSAIDSLQEATKDLYWF